MSETIPSPEQYKIEVNSVLMSYTANALLHMMHSGTPRQDLDGSMGALQINSLAWADGNPVTIDHLDNIAAASILMQIYSTLEVDAPVKLEPNGFLSPETCETVQSEINALGLDFTRGTWNWQLVRKITHELNHAFDEGLIELTPAQEIWRKRGLHDMETFLFAEMIEAEDARDLSTIPPEAITVVDGEIVQTSFALPDSPTTIETVLYYEQYWDVDKNSVERLQFLLEDLQALKLAIS